MRSAADGCTWLHMVAGGRVYVWSAYACSRIIAYRWTQQGPQAFCSPIRSLGHNCGDFSAGLACAHAWPHSSAYGSIWAHGAAYGHIRQHMAAHGRGGPHIAACGKTLSHRGTCACEWLQVATHCRIWSYMAAYDCRFLRLATYRRIVRYALQSCANSWIIGAKSRQCSCARRPLVKFVG